MREKSNMSPTPNKDLENGKIKMNTAAPDVPIPKKLDHSGVASSTHKTNAN